MCLAFILCIPATRHALQAELDEERQVYFDRLSEALREVARMREALDSGGQGAEDQLSTTALREKLEKFLRDIQQV